MSFINTVTKHERNKRSCQPKPSHFDVRLLERYGVTISRELKAEIIQLVKKARTPKTYWRLVGAALICPERGRYCIRVPQLPIPIIVAFDQRNGGGLTTALPPDSHLLCNGAWLEKPRPRTPTP
jgi:hypothetical protein